MITSEKMRKRLILVGLPGWFLQQELNGERLGREITTLVRDQEKVTAMEMAARKLARGDAAQRWLIWLRSWR